MQTIRRVTGPPPPPPPPPTPTPRPSTPTRGALDVIDANGNAMGWAQDPGAPTQSINVHFYADGPAGSGAFIGAVVANGPRPDITPGDHGFHFVIPGQYRDGRSHTLYVYGIDVTGDPNTLLTGSPRSFTLSPPSPTPTPTPPLFSDAAGWYEGHRFFPMDINGDGKNDLLMRYSSGTFAVWLSDGTRLNFSTAFETGYSDSSGWNSGHRFFPMDINGDGKDDMLMRGAWGDFYVWVSDGTRLNYSIGFSTYFRDDSGWYEGHRFFPMDINGDGKGDMLMRFADGGFDVWTSDGTRLNRSVWFATDYTDAWGWNSGHRFFPMDINGDGKDDMLMRGAGGDFYVWTSDGTRLNYSTSFTPVEP